MTIRPIRSAADHATTMKRIEKIFGAKPGTPEADELEVLATLVAGYERSAMRPPSALDAIRFRLAQAGLANRALEPLLGSRSRVSEIMSGKRELTPAMMRALHVQLGIPAESLLGVSTAAVPDPEEEPSARAMADLVATGLMEASERFADFVARAHRALSPHAVPQLAHLRKTRTDRTNAKTDAAALRGWCAAAILKSKEARIADKAKGHRIDAETGREVARLSRKKDGVKRVAKFLAGKGIALVLLRHFTGTYLDGAAMRRADGVYVIALTLRHDRIDNFWFTLLHELAHVACHLGGETSMIFDDLEMGSSETVEEEADCFAQKALIPDDVWRQAHADFGTEDVERLAELAGVHHAIVAGRWQREHRDYRKFSKLVGHGEVRRRLMAEDA